MRLRWPAAWAPAAKLCDCGDGTGSTPGGDVLCPPPSSPLGAGKRRRPSLGALCRRQGLQGQINGRPGGGPMALTSSARLSARASRLGPSNSGAGWPECASLWRRCTRSSRIRSASIGNGPRTSAGFRRACRGRSGRRRWSRSSSAIGSYACVPIPVRSDFSAVVCCGLTR
jgi:hypothetical protein